MFAKDLLKEDLSAPSRNARSSVFIRSLRPQHKSTGLLADKDHGHFSSNYSGKSYERSYETMDDRKYVVEFKIVVDANSKNEALELARDGVLLDYADVIIDGRPEV